MVDADAYVPGEGYLRTSGASEVLAAFQLKAEEFKRLKIPVSGDFGIGWLDSTYCCKIIAEMAGLEKPNVWLSPDEVKERLANAQWPDLSKLPRSQNEWEFSEYSNYLVAKAFVELCLQYDLQIQFD